VVAAVEAEIAMSVGMLAFALLVAAAVFAPLWLLARIGGWRTLAERYPRNDAMPPRKMWMGFAVFRGWVGYNGALVVASDARGLFLSALPILLWSHPPIFIPWADVERIEHRSTWYGRVHEIRVRRAPEVRFGLRERTYRFVQPDAAAAGVAGA